MKQDKKLGVIFVIILFVGFLGVVFNFSLLVLKVKEEVRDNYGVYQNKEEVNMLVKLENKLGNIVMAVENKVTNSFPFYASINTFCQKLNYDINKLFYKDVPLKKNSDDEYVFYNQRDNFYYIKNKYSDKELSKRLDKQVTFFNELSQKGVDVYIYVPTRYELTVLPKNNLNSYVQEFTSKLDKDIRVRVMDVQNVQDYQRYFYKTDHHWNIYGALNGYEDIMDMLGKEPLNDLKVTVHKERKYYGSMAKTALNDHTFDYILDVTKENTCDVSVNGGKALEEFKPRYIRLDRAQKFYDYYVQYFNGQYGNVVYKCANDSQDKLLIMSDSYAWQIDYLVADSFSETHVINLRYDEYKDKKFDIVGYMKKNEISKVLFLYEGGSTIFDQYDYDFYGRLK